MRALGVGLVSAFCAAAICAWVGCDGDEPTFPRTSVEDGDAATDGALSDGGDGSIADGGEADGDADADIVPGTRAIVTGSADHPDPLVGNGDHTCALAGIDRAVYCWGANDRGQLGIGTTGAGATTADVTTATKLATDETGQAWSGVDEITAAAWHGCARKGDVAFCWGQRFSGAQAEPPADPATDRTRPRAIGNLAISRIAAGGPHTCVLKTNGRIACFGHSYFNELGRGRASDPACTAPIFYDYQGLTDHTCSGDLTETNANVPNVAALTMGELSSCAMSGTGVRCWGTNTDGQLGDPFAGQSELNPQEVLTDPNLLTPLGPVTTIAAGGARHACAVSATKAWCWGSNAAGQLGMDPTMVVQRPTAAIVPGLENVITIGVAEGVSCVVKSDATAWCWGAAANGQLGDAGGATTSFTPIQIKGPTGVGALTGVKAVAPGKNHVCALRVDGTVWCWGKNDRGQLGDGTTTDSLYPVKVKGLPE